MFLGESQRSARGKRTGREKGRGRGLSEWTLSFQLQTYSHDTFWSGGIPLSLTNPVDKVACASYGTWKNTVRNQKQQLVNKVSDYIKITMFTFFVSVYFYC